MILLISSLPQSDTTQGQKRTSWLRFSHRPEVRGQSEHVIENLASPAVDDVVKGLISLLPSPEYAVVSCLTEGRVGKRLGERQIAVLQGFRGT